MAEIGEDYFMLSSDMPHGELRDSAVTEVEARVDLTTQQKQKIFHDNAVRFFGPEIARIRQPAESA